MDVVINNMPHLSPKKLESASTAAVMEDRPHWLLNKVKKVEASFGAWQTWLLLTILTHWAGNGKPWVYKDRRSKEELMWRRCWLPDQRGKPIVDWIEEADGFEKSSRPVWLVELMNVGWAKSKRSACWRCNGSVGWAKSKRTAWLNEEVNPLAGSSPKRSACSIELREDCWA